MAKTPVPITLDDLEATAKDDKAGSCKYGNLKVYWDDATNNFNYYWFNHTLTKIEAENYLRVNYGI